MTMANRVSVTSIIPFTAICVACILGSAQTATAKFQDTATQEVSPKSLTPGQPAAGPSDDGEWISLFNGKDLEGWTPKIVGYKVGDNYANTFRVVDGLLTVSYDDYADSDFEKPFSMFGHLFYKERFSHYVIRTEYRFVGEQCPNSPGWAVLNNGLMLHGQDPETMDLNQPFPVSIEVQLRGSNTRHRIANLNFCTPGTHVVLDGKLYKSHCTDRTQTFTEADQWTTVEIEVQGNEIIRHKINGETVLEYSQPQLDPGDATAKKLIPEDGNLMINEGTISIQSESHSTQFRKIELKKLSTDPNAN